MRGARVRGQPAATAAVAALLRGGVPHAILLAGPPGSGKTTLALDLAAALLCVADPGNRPCRSCRACRMVDGGNHPDLHRLAPGGPGAQIGIGGPDRPRGVRDLVGELALLPVEGGARVAIIEEAHRLNEDAQSALLKTLEEPPAGVVLLLCADEEERLLPTVRSRCARIRLGPVPVRVIEDWLVELGAADPPRAARLARIAGGRPGVALAYARAPEAEVTRSEIARQLLDLLDSRPGTATVAARDLLLRATALSRALDAPASPGDTRPERGRGRRRPALDSADTGGDPSGAPPDGADGTDAAATAAATGGKLSAQDRRRAALVLVRTWQDVARDLALVVLGAPGRVRDVGLLDELEDASRRLGPDRRSHPGFFLASLGRAMELIEGNVSPELAIDVLVLAWRRDGSLASSA